MAEKLEAFGPETMRNIEKQVLLQTIDGKWREHLLTAGTSAVGRRLPRLCAARPAERIQDRRLPAVRIDAELAAAGRDAEAGADPPDHQGRAGGDDGAAAGAAARGAGAAAHGPGCPAAVAPAWPRPRRLPVARARLPRSPGSTRPIRPPGATRPQRPLPLRLGREVQALPRPAGLTAGRLRRMTGRAWRPCAFCASRNCRNCWKHSPNSPRIGPVRRLALTRQTA